MTRQQGLFIRSLRDSFGFTQDQARELFRACGLKAPPQKWNDADVKRAEAILLECGPSYQTMTNNAARWDAEYKALAARKQRKQSA